MRDMLPVESTNQAVDVLNDAVTQRKLRNLSRAIESGDEKELRDAVQARGSMILSSRLCVACYCWTGLRSRSVISWLDFVICYLKWVVTCCDNVALFVCFVQTRLDGTR